MFDSASRDEAALRSAIAEASDDAIISADPRGQVTSWNRAAEILYGCASADAIGRPLGDVLAACTGSDDARDVIDRALAGETVCDVQALTRQDGVEISAAVTTSPIRRADDAVIGVLRIVRDLTPGRRLERATRRLAAIVESSDDAIVSKDLNGIVMSWNRSAEKMFGYTAAEMIGQSIRLLIPDERQFEEDHVLSQIRRGRKVEHYETIRRHKDGTLIPISLTVSPIHDDNGEVVGASKIARDISDRREIERERERLLALAEENAAVTEKLNHVGAIVASELDRDKVVQAVTDVATDLTGAEFGAFFYNVQNEKGELCTLYAISGVPRSAFERFPLPRNTAVFDPTFRGVGVVRSDDITKDPTYGRSAPHYGIPEGHLPVRSYLAVPVKSRMGDVLGGLFFGHSEAAQFGERHERLAAGIASWASVALENVGVQQASRLKDEFLATLSHELRTPLNAILGYARMLRSGLVPAEKRQRAIETIDRNATSLTQIVEDVLDVSRIISGKLRLSVQPVDVPSVLRSAVEAVSPAAEAKGIHFTLALPDVPAVSGDPERLQQVFWNLLSNAVKFTPRHGAVEVTVKSDDDHLEVIVADNGIGIAPEFLPFVFDRFRQADSGPGRAHGGLGLGLGIARQLVELHGGTIAADSAGTDQGATFRVRLPTALDNRVAAPQSLVSFARDRGPVHVGIPDLHGVRVLAVDDERDAAGMVREILEATGAQVSTANSGMEALRTLETLRPHVIVADLGMPHMDGFELIDRVRHVEDAVLRRVPAAALTAYARSEDRARALRSGYQMHLAKPIDPAELMAAVAALANRQDSLA
jgi:PAS domain S-box-containing protein